MTKNILTLLDIKKEDFNTLFARAKTLKENHRKGVFEQPLKGRTLGLLFDKASTRTRISFEAAMAQLGGVPVFINAKDTQMARNEPVKDTARVLSAYLDALAIRTYSQDILEAFAEYATIPVINALTDQHHPCQILSDLMTVIEFKGGYEGLKIAWIGDGNNMSHSWINAASVLGFTLILACPQGYQPDPGILERANAREKETILVTDDPVLAIENADVVNTDVWASMGQENEHLQRKDTFAPFQVNKDLLSHARKDAIVMHCLPVHREEEITDEVLEGDQSVVWVQAENKLHMHKAILEVLIRENLKQPVPQK